MGRRLRCVDLEGMFGKVFGKHSGRRQIGCHRIGNQTILCIYLDTLACATSEEL